MRESSAQPANVRRKQAAEWALRNSDNPLFTSVYLPEQLSKPPQQRSELTRVYCAMNTSPQASAHYDTRERRNEYARRYRLEHYDSVRATEIKSRKRRTSK